jgi:hypothetical protein
MSDLKHEGLHAHRLNPEAGNLREIAFAERWKRENGPYSNTLWELLHHRHGNAFSMISDRVEKLAPYDQHSASVAATVVQWLGSNVGFGFLEEALGDCGYKIVSKEKR